MGRLRSHLRKTLYHEQSHSSNNQHRSCTLHEADTLLDLLRRPLIARHLVRLKKGERPEPNHEQTIENAAYELEHIYVWSSRTTPSSTTRGAVLCSACLAVAGVGKRLTSVKSLEGGE